MDSPHDIDSVRSLQNRSFDKIVSQQASHESRNDVRPAGDTEHPDIEGDTRIAHNGNGSARGIAHDERNRSRETATQEQQGDYPGHFCSSANEETYDPSHHTPDAIIYPTSSSPVSSIAVSSQTRFDVPQEHVDDEHNPAASASLLSASTSYRTNGQSATTLPSARLSRSVLVDGFEDGDKVSGQTDGPQQAMWNPFWLRTPWLAAYALLFGLLSVAVLVLYLLSVRDHGLIPSSSTTSVVYFWRFLPTAVLVMLLSLWNPVDYFTRLLQPWKNLSEGPVKPSRSLLLDHVSPLQPVIMSSAIEHAEWPVVLGLGITMALTVVKVLSTGLLTVELTSVYVPHSDLVRTTSIDPMSWNASNEDYNPLELYNGIRNGNLTQPPWTGPDYVAQSFEIPAGHSTMAKATYAAYTRVLYPKLDCEEANLSWTKANGTYWNWAGPNPDIGIDGYGGGPLLNVTYTSASCEGQVVRGSIVQNTWTGKYVEERDEMYYGTI